MGGRTALAPAIAIWLGLCAGKGLPGIGIAVCATLAIGVAALAHRAGPRFGSVLLCVACLGAACARGGAHARRLSTASLGVFLDTRPQWVRGVVADHPWLESGEPAAIVEVRRAERCAALAGTRIRLWLPPGSDMEWGDPVEALAQLEPAAPRRVPGGFDARAAAQAQGLVAQGRALALRRTSRPASLVRATLVRWRRGVEEVLRRRLTPQAREIVTPLVIGDRSGVSAELAAGFQASGLTHLLALSGLHVVWMAGVARGLVALLGGGMVARAWAGALCAALYLGIAGPLPSLVRAAGAEWLMAWARARDRAIDPAQALAVQAAFTLALVPGWAGDLGFQLSCVATLGLVTIGSGARELVFPGARLPSALWRAVLPTMAAQTTAVPLLIARFHALPWTTLGANLLAVPICELLLASAWLGALVDALVPGGAGVAFGACEALSSALRWVVGRAAGAPVALWPTGHSAALPWLAAVGATALAWALAGPRTIDDRASEGARRWWAGMVGSLAVVLTLLLAAATRPSRPSPDRWWAVVLDVGQGDAIALGLPDGWWLVDAGPASARLDAGRAALLPFFRWIGARSLDTVVLTHAHLDHVGGAASLLSTLAARRLVLREGMRAPPGVSAASVREAVLGETLRVGAPPIVVRWPPAGMRARDENAISMALEIGSGERRALLAADVDSTIEASLEVTKLALLKVAHHGAGASSGVAALEAWRPSVAVISCGRHNPFGHPDVGALGRLAAAGASVHRTDREGTLWFEIGPRGIVQIDWRSDPPFETSSSVRPAPSAGRTLAGAPARW